MFRFPQQAASRTASPERTRHLLRRALLFGAGLALLWVALQLVPQRAPSPVAVPITEASEADDGVAVRSRPASSTLFSAGNITVLVLLLGGAGAAFFLRRRSKEGGSAAMTLQTLGQMSLAPNQQLRLVRCGDDVLLLGVTSGQITLLKTYDAVAFDEAASEEPAGSLFSEPSARPAAAPASDESAFARLLRQQVGGSLTVQKSEVS